VELPGKNGEKGKNPASGRDFPPKPSFYKMKRKTPESLAQGI